MRLFRRSTPYGRPPGTVRWVSTLASRLITRGALFLRNRFLPLPASGPSFFGSYGQTQPAFSASSSGFGSISNISASQSNLVMQPTSFVNPFGTLPIFPQMSIGRLGSSPSVQYGISSMHDVEKPNAVRRFTRRHVSKRVPARNYHPISDEQKGVEKPNSVRRFTLAARRHVSKRVLSRKYHPISDEQKDARKPISVRFSTLAASRHVSRRIRVSARKYHPKFDEQKVVFFMDVDDVQSTPKADASFIPRDNPRALVIRPLEQWPPLTGFDKLIPWNERKVVTSKNGKLPGDTLANGSFCEVNEGGDSFSSSTLSLPSSSSSFGFNQATPSAPTTFLSCPIPPASGPSFFGSYGQTQPAFSASSSGFGSISNMLSPNTFIQSSASQSNLVMQPTSFVDPSSTLLIFPQMSFGRVGSSPSVQYGISSMPDVEKPNAVRRFTRRHVSKRVPARKYHPISDEQKDVKKPISVRLSTLAAPRNVTRRIRVLARREGIVVVYFFYLYVSFDVILWCHITLHVMEVTLFAYSYV